MGTGSSKPTNKTGKNVVRQKMETASKTGVLSLREHDLTEIPSQVFELTIIRTLDLSKNKLKVLPVKLSTLKNLKSLNLDNNKLHAITHIESLQSLQTLSCGKNVLGIVPKQSNNGPSTKKNPSLQSPSSSPPPPPLPALPPSLKQLKLDSNHLTSIPRAILSPSLTKLTKIDLSHNNLASIPDLSNLASSLTELNLSHNSIPSLSVDIGKLTKLKSLSLEYNAITVTSTSWSEGKNVQPLPRELFELTQVVDLNLKGNSMTNTQLNEFEGFQSFLERREKIKTKNIYGGALTDLSVCGLD